MLGTFGTKKNKSVEVSKPTFQERLGDVKSMFKRAYEDALRLDTEMQASIDRKNYDYSWNEELITLEEYKNRCNRSTCLHHCNFQ